MRNSLLKPILKGVFFGALFFMLPFFILKMMLFFMVGTAICFLFFGRHRRRMGMGFGPQFADKIRSMSDEEYSNFKNNFQGHCMHRPKNTTNEPTPTV